MKKLAAAAGFALALIISAPVMAQQAAQPSAKKGHDVRVMTQQPLTLQEAKNAIDSLMLLREKYKDQKFKGSRGGPAGVIEGMKNSAVRDKILADLKSFGFNSIEDWVGKFVSVGMAVSYVQRNKDGALEKKIAMIRNNPNMPQEMKSRLLAIMTALIPPPQNAEIASQLLADPGYAAKLKKLIRSRPDSSKKN